MRNLGETPVAKIDYKAKLRHLYAAAAERPALVEVPEMNFLMLDGAGNPNDSPEYKNAVEALFALSYAIKFKSKKARLGVDYVVMPLEGLWWTDDMSTFSVHAKDEWKWTLMIMQPDVVTAQLVKEATDEVGEKKNPPSLSKVRFDAFAEGKAAQVMHIGPFSEEGPTVQQLHAFIEAQGGQLRGKHHEIYLSDIRKAAPHKWKTIIRQPMT